MALPRFVVLKSKLNEKYLRYIHQNGDVPRILQSSGDEVTNPYAKFELEMANDESGLVHIRCCSSNKYWVLSQNPQPLIVPDAEYQEDDKSKPSCTLFEPVFVDGDEQTVRFRHIHLGAYARLYSTTAPPLYESCLFALYSNPDQNFTDVFTIIDWETLVVLPKYVAFKGNNSNYLSAYSSEGDTYLQFSSPDSGEEAVANEVFITSDGHVRIKSTYLGKFWKRNDNHWILVDSDDSTNDNLDTLFWPVKIDKNIIALRNLGNNNFCERTSSEGNVNCLNAAVPTMESATELEVIELVILRKIFNVSFRLSDSRIYQQSSFIIATSDVDNMTQQPVTVQVKLPYTNISSITWNSNMSLNLGKTVEIHAGIPVIKDGKIEISADSTGEYQWGETVSYEIKEEHPESIVVRPMTRVILNLMVTKASCDFPFSYTQKDKLMNGEFVSYEMDDGVFTGMNYFNIYTEIIEQDL